MLRWCSAFFLLVAPALAQSRVQSPNGAVALELAVGSSGQLTYKVLFRGKPLIRESKLGLDPVNQPVLGEDVALIKATPGTVDETYSMPYGKSAPLRNHANVLTWELQEKAGLRRLLNLEARAYDDGAAFRYVVPEQGGWRDVVIEREMTQFQFAREGTAWALEVASFRTSFEDNYVIQPISGLRQNALITLPFLAEIPGVAWVGITEAHLENYAGLYLVHGNGRTMEARLAPRADNPEVSVRGTTPLASPWRVLLIGDQPGRLIESNLVLHLNPPSRIRDTSWIHPGKTAWNWWSDDFAANVSFQRGMNTDTMKHYIEFAAEAGLPYMLIDAGWAASAGPRLSDLTRTSPRIDMPELLRHAKEKNVRLWLWAYWTDIDRQMDEAFATFEKWGIAGVKIDFMDRDDQSMVDFYHRVAKNAAAHHLLIDFHGAYKPTGMARYYPNVLTHEGVLGLEYLKWSGRATADHNTILPFTRGLAGPMDYTPGGFNNVTPAEFEPRNANPMVLTTRAHQMALYVVLESPFQMLADYPGAYRGEKELDFLKAVPVAWDETRVLGGRPGEWVSIARRKGRDWFVGAITNSSAREVELPLDFLGAGSFTAESYADTDVPKSTQKASQTVDSTAPLKLRLAPSGGHAMIVRSR